MRLAVISDIHGNLEALKEVLTDIDHRQVDRIVCLGDNVGYGPEPEAVIRRIRERNIKCVMGNHELGLTHSKYINWFNMLARQSLMQTKELLSGEALEFCGSLPHSRVTRGCLCVHGCPPHSVLRYVFEPPEREMIRIFKAMEQSICFVGHTHMLEVYDFDGHHMTQTRLGRDRIKIEPDHKYIVNVGSVGQPRDTNNREAKYVILDRESMDIEVVFVPYNALATVEKIRELGWPSYLADRLL